MRWLRLEVIGDNRFFVSYQINIWGLKPFSRIRFSDEMSLPINVCIGIVLNMLPKTSSSTWGVRERLATGS